jgi:hypothetical protein
MNAGKKSADFWRAGMAILSGENFPVPGFGSSPMSADKRLTR